MAAPKKLDAHGETSLYEKQWPPPSDAINQTHDAISPSMSLSPRSITEAIRLGSATYTEHVRR